VTTVNTAFAALATAILLFAASTVPAAAEEAAGPAIVETYTCNYLPGKDRGDLMGARDYYVRQAEKAGIELPNSFLWTLYKGAVPMDLVWLTAHPSMAAYAAQTEREAAAPELADIGARFDAVGKCSAGLGTIRQVFAGGQEPVTEPPSLVVANACNLRHGVTETDLNDLFDHAARVLATTGAHDAFALYALSPITNGPNTADVYIFGVNDSLSAWSERVAAMGAAEGAPMLRRHFEATLECNTALFFGEPVIGGNGE